MSDEITKLDLENCRRKDFRVEVKRPLIPGEPGEITLTTTSNGYQWTSINLTPIERLKVIKALLMDVL